MFQKRFFLLSLVVGLALSQTSCGPLSAAFNDPHGLPALGGDGRVRYQPGAEDFAREIERLLPDAMARVEATHGRPFGRPFIVAAFLDDEAYAGANGRGNAIPNGVTFLDRVTLSPRLWREDRKRLAAYLTHELSHEHLQSLLSAVEYIRIPVWFTEGIAVMASNGGGAQLVPAENARRAICAGRVIETPDQPLLFGNVSLKAPEPNAEGEDILIRMHMAYRQAGLFVAFLNDIDPTAFETLLDRLYAGGPFKEAFEASYNSTVAQIRLRFLATCARI